MRSVWNSLLSFILILMFSVSSQANELDVQFHPQHTLVWCWAATIAMVGEYMTGQPSEDCGVLSAYDLALGGPGTCCFFPQPCNRTGQVQEMKNILGNLYHLSGFHYTRALSYGELRNQIDNECPIIAALQTNFSGHVVVIIGYELPNRVIVLDPMSGRHEVLYQQLLANFQTGYWRQTLTVNRSATITDPDPDPIPQAHYCCDQFGIRRCTLPTGPLGIVCSCFGISGSGVSCP
jgi:hypothetical protein